MRYALLALFLMTYLSSICQYRAPIHPVYQKEIKKLARNKKVKKAFEFIRSDEKRTLREHVYLTEIPAPPFKEDKRAEAFMEMLVTLEADSAWIDKMGNVLCLVKGRNKHKTVCIDGHLDTVFPEGTDVQVKIRGDTLFALGIADDTRSLAMIICLIRALEYSDISTEADLLFVGSVGEEGLGDLRGVKHLFSHSEPKIHSWISIDGGAIGRINNQALGSHRYRISFKGPGGHSWGAFGLVNPHHALGSAISHFVAEADKFTSYGDRTSYNVGRIGGGTSVNSVPFESWMEVDMRSVSPERLDSIDMILKDVVQKALDEQNKLKRLGKDLEVVVEKIGDRPSGEASPELPLVQRAMACTAYFGKRPELTRGSTNSNIPISMGIPAITIGRGGVGANAHSLDEWWIDKEGYRSIQLAFLLMLSEAGME